MVDLIETFDIVSSNVQFLQVVASPDVFESVDAVNREGKDLQRAHLAHDVDLGEVIRTQVEVLDSVELVCLRLEHD